MRPLDTRIHPADEMYRFEPRRCRIGRRDAAAVLYFARAASSSQTSRASSPGGSAGSAASVASWISPAATGADAVPRRGAAAREDLRSPRSTPPPSRSRRRPSAFAASCRRTEPESLALAGRLRPRSSRRPSSAICRPPRFEAWLARLYGCLAPGGVLALQRRTAWTCSPIRAADRARPASRFGRSARRSGWTATSTGRPTCHAGVRARAWRRAPAEAEARLVAFPLGLCGYQDLYVLLRPPVPLRPRSAPSRASRGRVDYAAIEDGIVSARGWAEGDRGRARRRTCGSLLGTVREASCPGEARRRARGALELRVSRRRGRGPDASCASRPRARGGWSSMVSWPATTAALSSGASSSDSIRAAMTDLRPPGHGPARTARGWSCRPTRRRARQAATCARPSPSR